MDEFNAKRPKDALVKEWEEACDRAERARKYACTILGQEEGTILTKVEKYQDPMWQWEHETRGRMRELQLKD